MDKPRAVSHPAFPVRGDNRFNVRPNSGMSMRDVVFLSLLSGCATRQTPTESDIEKCWQLANKALELREKYK